MRIFFTVITIFLLLSACKKDIQPVETFLNSLPHVYPKEINRFQSVDSLFFSHLGYTTIALENGILIYDRDQEFLVKTDSAGNLKKYVARSGRGPGEVLDISSLVRTEEGNILIYDQGNQKVIRFNKELEYIGEFIPEPFEASFISDIYPAKDSARYIVELSSYAYLYDKNKVPKRFFARYNAESNTYGKTVTLKDRLFARLVIDNQLRGGREVFFSPNQLIAYHASDQSLYIYWTGSSQIAEVSESFDTLRTISIELPKQKLSSEERDSIREKTRPEQWKTLGNLLPDVKAPVEKMKVDPKGRFWLRLNYRGETQQWLILSPKGKAQKIVHLPKGGMLTHISEDHLGVRINDVTFALFEKSYTNLLGASQ